MVSDEIERFYCVKKRGWVLYRANCPKKKNKYEEGRGVSMSMSAMHCLPSPQNLSLTILYKDGRKGWSLSGGWDVHDRRAGAFQVVSAGQWPPVPYCRPTYAFVLSGWRSEPRKPSGFCQELQEAAPVASLSSLVDWVCNGLAAVLDDD